MGWNSLAPDAVTKGAKATVATHQSPLVLAVFGAVAFSTVVGGAAPDSASPPRATGAAIVPGRGAQPLGAQAVVDTPWVVERPHPRATYGSFGRAGAGLRTLVRRALGAYADSGAWQRADTSFLYRDQVELRRSIQGDPYWVVNDREKPSRVSGLRMSLTTHTVEAPDVASIRAPLEAAGWAEDAAYSADGPDGTVFAYVCREALCVVQGSWDGGDGSDSTYMPEPGESIELLCVPRVPGRAPKR